MAVSMSEDKYIDVFHPIARLFPFSFSDISLFILVIFQEENISLLFFCQKSELFCPNLQDSE